MTTVTPGLHRMTNVDYHHHDSLSASGAKTLLRSPAHYRWQKDHPVFKDTYDFGSAAHKYVLQDEDELVVVIDAPDWKTKAARDARDEAREAGHIPVLKHVDDMVRTMAQRIQEHPIASLLFAPGSGVAEQAMFWEDPETGVMLRAKPDWLPHRVDGHRLIVPDYKTAADASKDGFARSAATFGYNLQAEWYSQGIQQLGLDDDPAFVFVVQEKDPPYLVVCYELDVVAREIAQRKIRQAVNLYAHCTSTNTWPGYSQDVELLSMPSWYEYQNRED